MQHNLNSQLQSNRNASRAGIGTKDSQEQIEARKGAFADIGVMKFFRSSICGLTAVALLVAPASQAVAQTSSTHVACIGYPGLPVNSGIWIKFSSDHPWQFVSHADRNSILSSTADNALVAILKPYSSQPSDATADNTRIYSIKLTPSADSTSCQGLTPNYQVQLGSDGWILVQVAGKTSPTPTPSPTAPTKREGPSTAAMVVGGLLGLALLSALMSGSSSSGRSDSSSQDNERRNADRIAQQQIARSNAERAEADRAVQAQRAAEAYERLQRPNSLGW